MILQKEFYFVRHGQTDHNLRGVRQDHPPEIPLNDTGRMQAKVIEPIIASLPVKIVCSSPFIRAQETKEIITANLEATHHEFEDLGECSSQIWSHMVKHGMYAPLPEEGPARVFMERVRRGINQALSLPGPILVVSHGGVHWALCCLMGIEEYEWATQNCTPIHFSIGTSGKWTAKKLI